ncbi:hypothetical protein Taro_040445 [Colocasia esculenta]|uniref:Uncharacterized protein n=1 Tax=Colocasia esculenta TaxID=4460 RepID=A0A843WUK8_COLES|nr:hypothetical protein [Colocasia esculenta]
MMGGASSSREDPGRSVLKGQLATAVARAEDALAQAREREAKLRDSLAQTTALKAEMAELRLCPEAAELTRWRQEAEEATRLCAEVGGLRTQLGEERHRCELLRSEMKGLERALALRGHVSREVSAMHLVLRQIRLNYHGVISELGRPPNEMTPECPCEWFMVGLESGCAG